MTIKFVLITNSHGQIRIAKYFEKIDCVEKEALESDVIKRTISRHSNQCSFFEFQVSQDFHFLSLSILFLLTSSGF